MRIVRGCVRHYRVPRHVWWSQGPVAASIYEISDVELLIVELETGDGARGAGFTYTVGHGGCAVRALLEHEVLPALLDREVGAIEPIWDELHERLHFVGSAGVTAVSVAAADIALWDALACEADLPLYRYLGPCRTEVPAYASAVNLALSREELVEQMVAYRDQGFRALKMKVGKALGEDVERVAAVRAAVGSACELMVDANMAWDLPDACRRLSALEPLGIAWLEEPLPPHDLEGHAALQRSTSIPIAAGETLFTPQDFVRYIRHEAIRIPQPDVTRLGVTGWRRVAAIAAAFGLPLAPHFIPEIHIHLMCTVSNALYLEYLPIFERLLDEPLEPRDGVAKPSEAPGHGMRFAPQILEPYQLTAKEVVSQ